MGLTPEEVQRRALIARTAVPGGAERTKRRLTAEEHNARSERMRALAKKRWAGHNRAKRAAAKEAPVTATCPVCGQDRPVHGNQCRPCTAWLGYGRRHGMLPAA